MTEEIETRKKENKAKRFIPNGKSEEFIINVGTGTIFVNLFIAANGVGKSAAGANIVTNLCYGPQNKFFEYPLFQNFPHLKRGRIISDPTTLKEKIIPELKKWFPSNRYEAKYDTRKEGKPYEAKWMTDTGFEFDLMSNEQDAKEFESTDLGWAWFDEPPPKAVFTATVARMRLGGRIFMTLTPLFHSAWIKDDLFDKRDGVNVEYVTATVEDNCRQHGIRGILEHDNIQKMIGQYKDDEKEARIEGRFGHLIGRILKKFDRKIHVIRPFEMKPEDYCVYQALDTHPQVDDHALWMAIDRRGQKFFIAEFVGKGTVAQMASEFKRIEGGMRVEGRLIDPSAFNKDERQEDSQTIAEKFRAQGFVFEPGSKDLINGIKRLQDAFDYTMVESEMVKKPEVFIFDTCPIAIQQLENYVWKKQTTRAADTKQERGQPIDKDDHQPENARRLVMQNFKYIEHVEESFQQPAYQGSSEYDTLAEESPYDDE